MQTSFHHSFLSTVFHSHSYITYKDDILSILVTVLYKPEVSINFEGGTITDNNVAQLFICRCASHLWHLHNFTHLSLVTSPTSPPPSPRRMPTCRLGSVRRRRHSATCRCCRGLRVPSLRNGVLPTTAGCGTGCR